MSINDVSRRHFFFGSLLAGAVPAAGFGSVPSLRSLGYKPFYDKLNVAAIGCGGQGGADLNDAARTENIVALCDVDVERGSANLKKFSGAALTLAAYAKGSNDRGIALLLSQPCDLFFEPR